MQHPDLFSDSPGPQMTRAPDDPEAAWSDLAADLGSGADQVWALGHDVIFVTLALRTLQARPELTTPNLVGGLQVMIAWCRERPIEKTMDALYGVDVSAVETSEVDLEASRDGPQELARLSLETLVGFERIYEGAHQGNVGHVMDHAQALLELERLGFGRAARSGWSGFRRHVAVLRHLQGIPLQGAEVEASVAEDPRRVAYWELNLMRNDWAYGHAFKYPYHLYDLARLAEDPSLALAAERQVGRLI